MRKLLFECFPEHLLWDTLAVRDTALRRPDKSGAGVPVGNECTNGN